MYYNRSISSQDIAAISVYLRYFQQTRVNSRTLFRGSEQDFSSQPQRNNNSFSLHTSYYTYQPYITRQITTLSFRRDQNRRQILINYGLVESKIIRDVYRREAMYYLREPLQCPRNAAFLSGKEDQHEGYAFHSQVLQGSC